MLQCVAVCCSVLQSAPHALHYQQCRLEYDQLSCSVLQCVAMCCNVLQCVTVCCRVLQCVTSSHARDARAATPPRIYAVCCGVCYSVLHCVAVCCGVCYSVLQCVAIAVPYAASKAAPPGVCKSCLLQCFTMCCNVLQSFARCCSVLWCVAVCCNVLPRVAVC